MKTSYCQYATNNRPSMLTMQSMISLWCYLVQQAPTSVISHRHLYSFNKNLRHSSWSWRALSWVGCEPVASPVNTQWLKRLATLTVDLNIHYVNPTNISHQYKTPAHYAARHGSIKSFQVLLANDVDITQGIEQSIFQKNLSCAVDLLILSSYTIIMIFSVESLVLVWYIRRIHIMDVKIHSECG